MVPSRITAVLVATLLALSGCGGMPASDTPGKPFTTISAAGCSDDFDRAPPAAPNATTAKSFALACETSRIVKPDEYVHRDADVIARGSAGFYVRASVLVGTETGRTSGVYFVGNGTYTRITAEHRDVDEYFHSENPDENSALDAYVLNFGDRDRRLRLTLTYLNRSPSEVVFNRSYSLSSGTGVVLAPVTMRIGTYDVTLAAGGEQITTERIQLTENRSSDLLVVIGPDGEPLIARSSED